MTPSAVTGLGHLHQQRGQNLFPKVPAPAPALTVLSTVGSVHPNIVLQPRRVEGCSGRGGVACGDAGVAGVMDRGGEEAIRLCVVVVVHSSHSQE